MMPALELDTAGAVLLERYQRHRAALNALGIQIGRPRIAVCSQPFRDRSAYPYFDLDFWSDPGRSIWRPMRRLGGGAGDRALRLPFPLRSESLRGLQGLRQVPVTDDRRHLELRARPAAGSLDEVLGPAR